jgi:phosphatidate cytidylyltransferase
VSNPETAPCAANPSALVKPASAAAARRFDIRRVYTAAVLAPALYVVIRYLPAWAFALLLIAGGTLALIELYRMSFNGRTNGVLTGIGLATSALLIAHLHLPISLSTILVVGVLTLLAALLWPSASIEYRFKDAAVTLFGMLYLGITLSALVATRALPAGEFLVLFVLLVTWAADTGAYYAGTMWGRRLLAPTISPKKTIEGLIGGMALAVGISLLMQSWLLPQLSVIDALVLGLLLTGTGLIGDLSESAIKRSLGVKDSGGILPGHGGMLDRLDSVLFTAPTFYYYVTLVRGLSPLS